jgi:hypothetical protein
MSLLDDYQLHTLIVFGVVSKARSKSQIDFYFFSPKPPLQNSDCRHELGAGFWQDWHFQSQSLSLSYEPLVNIQQYTGHPGPTIVGLSQRSSPSMCQKYGVVEFE